MKISEVIAVLEGHKENLGDVNVMFTDDGECVIIPIVTSVGVSYDGELAAITKNAPKA